MDEKKLIKRKQMSNSFIYLLIGGFILIMIVSLTMLSSKTLVQSNPTDEGHNTEGKIAKGNKSQLTAIITGRDNKMIKCTLRNIEDGQDVSLTITDGSSVMDKYGKNITVESLKIGDIAKVTYDTDTDRIISLKLWDKAWRYEGIQNWSVNTEEGSFTIADRLYQYPDYLFVTRNGKPLTLEELDKTDELMAIGYDKTIYSILVTKGHGTLHFEDYGDFLGGTVYIGNKEVLPIEEYMTATVREGDYDITMEKGDFTGTKTVTVLPDQETEVNMGEFKKPPVNTCKVTFHIEPLGAELFLDNQSVPYGDPIDMKYGDHTIKVALGGYKSYTGTLTADAEEKDIFIKLVEENNNSEESSAKENNSGSNETGAGSEKTDSSDTSTTSTKNYVYIQSPDGASVYVNGEFKGIAPVSFPKTTFGQLYITLIQSGYDTKTYTVEVKDDGEDVKLNFPALEASK